MADKDQKSASHLSPFDAIRHVDEQLGEYWSARELYKILGYPEWRNFNNVVIKRAIKACEENGRVVSEHFVQSYKCRRQGREESRVPRKWPARFGAGERRKPYLLLPNQR